jgi:hypothetical protein
VKFRHKKLPTTETKLEGFWRYVVVAISRYRCNKDDFVTTSYNKHSKLADAEHDAKVLNDDHALRFPNEYRVYLVAEWQLVDGEFQLRLMKDPPQP